MGNEANDMRTFAENLWRYYIADKVKEMMLSPYPMWKSYRAEVISVNNDNTMTVQAPFDAQIRLPYLPSAAGLKGRQGNSRGDQCAVLVVGDAVNSCVIGKGDLTGWDVVVEEGTFGQNGKWRKWAGGTAEVWGGQSVYTTTGITSGNLYRSQEQSVHFPSGLFTNNAPIFVQITAGTTDATKPIFATLSSIPTNNGFSYIVMAGEQISAGYDATYYARGNWK